MKRAGEVLAEIIFLSDGVRMPNFIPASLPVRGSSQA
jgi:hypothetical protein